MIDCNWMFLLIVGIHALPKCKWWLVDVRARILKEGSVINVPNNLFISSGDDLSIWVCHTLKKQKLDMHGSEISIPDASTSTSCLSLMEFFILFRSWNDDLHLESFCCEPIVIGFSVFCEARHHTVAHQTIGNYLHFLTLALWSITRQCIWSCLSVDHWCKMKASPWGLSCFSSFWSKGLGNRTNSSVSNELKYLFE